MSTPRYRRRPAQAAKADSAKPPRRPGRPAATAGVDRRARLLDAALALFGEAGIGATTLRAIAQRARVTPALLHYYFASKDSLVETILAERVAPFLAVSMAPLREPLPSPRATLRRFLEIHMRNIAANPWMPRLMLREVLSEGGSLRGRMQAQFALTVAPKMLALIASAQRKGEIRDDLNPLFIGVSLISLAVFPFAAAPVWREAGASLFEDLPAHLARALRTPLAAAGAATDSAGPEGLIEHTLTLFDDMLEKPRAKSKR
ncbi:TetR/AcrR family transcriptional regulator [Rudaea sp.]|uniref:TetR/AcrR family transcriptional regulator n=1 Tax=Rudaea sp. TaxID=2136325 RepID=UPI0032202B1D